MICLNDDIYLTLAKQQIKEWQQEAARARIAAVDWPTGSGPSSASGKRSERWGRAIPD
jgi:hypothetical protein